MSFSQARVEEQADVVIGQLSPEAAGLEIVSKLTGKGFCVVAPGFDEKVFQHALDELSDFTQDDRWQQVNSTVQDGLLGAEGSALIAELETPGTAGAKPQDSTLSQIDTAMMHLGFHMEPYMNSCGLNVSHRSRSHVHQAGEPGEDPVPLTEKDVTKWLAIYLRHKVMVIVFLGPSVGTLELKPYNTEDAETFEIKTYPGTLVVLRPDVLSHKHFSPGRSFAMSSFFLKNDSKTGGTKKTGDTMIPAAKELDDWSMSRLRELKEKNLQTQFWDPDIPKDWRSAMNHMFHKGQMIGCPGMACKVPSTDNPNAFAASLSFGPDFPGEVPRMRWDHEEVYDADPESWRTFKSYCRHGSFMDGIELFDCKMFSMSPNEAKSMDPHQRLILEVGYEALHAMGQRKNTLVNSACGVYVGCGNQEWGVMPKELEQGAFAATGEALSISSGRFSFTLGLKGPSMTLDTDASSGATGIYLAAESVQRKGRASPNEFAVAIGAHLLLAPLWWPTQCAAGWLCATGRCLTFDSSASGYVRSDGVAAVTVRSQSQLVDGKYVASDDTPLGSIAGATMNNNGKGASLASPHGPAEQEAMSEAVRNAGIQPSDVDAVEAFGSGAFLADAIELGSFARAHRSEECRDPPLMMTALKSSQGNAIETSGVCGFMKVIHSMQSGHAQPNLHLRQANPHTDLEDQPVSIVTEIMEYQRTSSFVGVMSRGFGGSNIYLVLWGTLSERKREPKTVVTSKDQIMFWPGGGGALAEEALPSRCYTIIGSWTQWTDPAPMEAEGDGTYGFTVVLGETRFETFQIWLDGDSQRVLHPGHNKGYKDNTVFGPDNLGHGFNWMIDGRHQMHSVTIPEQYGKDGLLKSHSEGEVAALVPSSSEGPAAKGPKLPGADFGMPGDAYRVRLKVIGKWRTVSWEKLSPDQHTASLVEQFQRERLSQFYVAGSWNDWNLSEMTADPARPGAFQTTAMLWRSGGEFQILRNRDWCQVVHPSEPRCKRDAVGAAEGPDDKGHGLNWFLDGQAGDTFRIEMVRSGEGDSQQTSVSWDRLDQSSQSSAASRASYCIVGSWTAWQSIEEMEFDGQCYRYLLQIGSKGEESFQILLDGLWERILHPDRSDACPQSIHVLQGPSINAHGLNWTVGRNDEGLPGSRYEVKLTLTRNGSPKTVEWTKVA